MLLVILSKMYTFLFGIKRHWGNEMVMVLKGKMCHVVDVDGYEKYIDIRN